MKKGKGEKGRRQEKVFHYAWDPILLVMGGGGGWFWDGDNLFPKLKVACLSRKTFHVINNNIIMLAT